MECAAFCIDGSREVAGYTTTVEDVLSEVGEFKKFSRNYGATLSGGEPTLQWNFYIELLKGFKSCGCNTAVETNGSSVNLVESAEWVDLFIIDIKHIDDAKHVELTGCSNANVLSNVRELAKRSHTVWVRIPLIPGINDGENLSETARFLKSINNGNLSVEILGYHRLGEYKWEAVGKEYPMKDTAQPSERDVANARGVFRDQGINVIVT